MRIQTLVYVITSISVLVVLKRMGFVSEIPFFWESRGKCITLRETHNESRVTDASHLSVGDAAMGVRLAGVWLELSCYCCCCFFGCCCCCSTYVSEVVSVLAVVCLGALVREPMLSGCKDMDELVRKWYFLRRKLSLLFISSPPFRDVAMNTN